MHTNMNAFVRTVCTNYQNTAMDDFTTKDPEVYV